MLNTSLHVPGEADLALDLFKDNFVTEAYKSGSKYTKPDFEEFARRKGINERRFTKIYKEMISNSDSVKKIIYNSFLRDGLKKVYYESYLNRLH